MVSKQCVSSSEACTGCLHINGEISDLGMLVSPWPQKMMLQAGGGSHSPAAISAVDAPEKRFAYGSGQELSV